MKYGFFSCIRGFHIYKDVWEPIVGEELECKIEDNNEHDRHAVAVMKEDRVVGHIPREHSKVCKFFIKRGGCINVVVCGKRENRGQGLQIPSKYTFDGSSFDIAKLKKLLGSGSD